MTDAEKFKHISEYVRRRYKQESDVWADADIKGEVINAAKASSFRPLIRGFFFYNPDLSD